MSARSRRHAPNFARGTSTEKARIYAIEARPRPTRRGSVAAWVALFALSSVQCGRETFDLLPASEGMGGSPAADAGEGNSHDAGKIGLGGKNQGVAGGPACNIPVLTEACSESLCPLCTSACTGVCTRSGWCVECLDHDDCDEPNSPNTFCNPHINRCTQPCGSGQGCPGDRKNCIHSSSSYCVECLTNDSCPDDEPICHFGRCVQCFTDCECAARFDEQVTDGLKCVSGQCVCRRGEVLKDCPPNPKDGYYVCDTDGRATGNCEVRD